MSARTPMDEAAGWVLRLQDPSANAATFLEWHRWLAAATENRTAFDEVEETLLRLADIETKPTLPSVVEMAADFYDGSVPVSKYLAEQRPARRSDAQPLTTADSDALYPINNARFRYGVAAGLVAVSIICGWLGFDAINESRHGVFAYATAPGERKDFSLPDGSRITLDADSTLNVELTRGQRTLRLARGEAYFEVAKDPSRPFVVSAGGARVRAVGTEFNVRMGDHRTVVAVVEGLVQVAALSEAHKYPDASTPSADPTRVAQVSAGQAVAYNADSGLQSLPASEASLATSWLEGRRQYRNEPLQYVLADVDRYTGHHIVVADEATAALKFTGTLNLTNSDAWLKALSIALPVTVTQMADGTLQVSSQTTGSVTTPPKAPAAVITIDRHARSGG